MDKSWIHKHRQSIEYLNGLDEFLKFANVNSGVEGRIICPCPKCRFKKWQLIEVVRQHLIVKPFPEGYNFWSLHGEMITEDLTVEHPIMPIEVAEPIVRDDPVQDIVHDAFGVHHENKRNKRSLTMPHTTGSKSLARKKTELAEVGGSMTRSDVWTTVHKRVDGSYINDETRAVAEKNVSIQQEDSSSEELSTANSLAIALGTREHSGRVRGFELGVCSTQVFGRGSAGSSSQSGPSYHELQIEVERLKAAIQEQDVEQQRQDVEQQRRYVEQQRRYVDIATRQRQMEATIAFLLQNFQGQLPPKIAGFHSPGPKDPNDCGSGHQPDQHSQGPGT